MSNDQKWNAFERLSQSLCSRFAVHSSELQSGNRRRPVSDVRQLLSYAAYRLLGLSAAEISAVMGVSAQE